MKKLLFGSLLGALLAVPAHAQPATMEQVLAELASLNERVGKLEQANGRLLAENAELRSEKERLAEPAPKIVESERVAKAAEWASRITWKADLRYRHENVDPQEAPEEQVRHRIRARFGLSGKINDALSGTIQLATNGANNDPRSTNQTLGEGNTRKGVGIDLAYVDWKPVEGLSLLAGKMPQPWYKVNSLFFDGDITPEGMAAKYASGPFFASAFGYWLSERSSANDATLLGGQIGMSGSVGGVKLTGAVGYFDVGAVAGQIATTSGAACVANPAFFGGPQGNTTVLDGAGCATLANDFNVIDVIGQAEMTLAGQPLVLFAQFLRNQKADDLDSGYELGFNFGKAGNPQTWELGYAYHVVEKDAQFGQFVDSDFGGGVTDAEGSVFKLVYAPAKNWAVNGTYFLNDRFVDAPGATERDYDRYQIDLNYKF